MPEWNFEKAVMRQITASDQAHFFIIQERSANVLRDLTVKDTDGTVYEIKGEEAEAKHLAMLRQHHLVFQYTPRDEYVSYRRRVESDPEGYYFDLKKPVE